MKTGSMISIAGIIMVILGAIMFYGIQNGPHIELALRQIRHAGTFIGLLGIGVTLAGILLYLINRSQPHIQEDVDFQE